jgi:hypothetical protein
MLKNRSQATSIVVTLIFCLSLVVPAFVTPDIAGASSIYEVLKAPSVKASNTPQDLGVIKVSLSDTRVAGGSILTVSLPSDVEVVSDKVYVVSKLVYEGIQILANGNGDHLPDTAFKSTSFQIRPNNTFDIVMADPVTTASGDITDQYFYIYFNGINLKNTAGDINIDFLSPSSSSFSSAMGLVIAKASGSESTTVTTCNRIIDILPSGGKLEAISINEMTGFSLNPLKSDGKITMELLTPGFSWGTSETFTVQYGWGFSDINNPISNLTRING